MSWHCIFLYIDNVVSLMNLMLSHNSDRDRVYQVTPSQAAGFFTVDQINEY
jgi:hypothetical protein